MKKNYLSKAVAIALVAGVATPSIIVHAQDAGALMLEEVVVSATRRQENLQDVPVAVSAITGEALRENGIFQTNDLNNAAPNLQVASPYGEQQPNFSLRGVGVGTEFNANSASPVGVYVDEVYQTFRASHGQQLYDLNQVEVVRGPQGTLFGRNTTGGAINFITRQPDLGESNGYLTVGYGNYDRRAVSGAFEVTPVEGEFGIRLALNYVDSDPYIENRLPQGLNTFAANGASGLNFNTARDSGGSENIGGRLIVRWAPTDSTDFSLKLYAAKSQGGTEAPIPFGQSRENDVIDFTNTNFLLSPLFGPGLGLLPSSYSQSANGFGINDIEMDSVGAAKTESEGIVFTAKIDLNDRLSLINITGFDSGLYSQQNTDCDASPLRACSIGYRSDFEAINQDIRLDYTNDRLKLTAGFYYGLDKLESDNTPDFFNFLSDVRAAVGLPADYFNPGGFFSGEGLPLDASSLPTGIRATQEFEQERTSYAVYAEGTFNVTHTVSVTAGLRRTDDENEFAGGFSTFYDDEGTARLVTVSDFQQGGSFAPYFLEDLRDEAGNVVVPSFTSLGIPLPGPLEQEGSSAQTSGRLIVDWKPTDNLMVYGSYSRGYRAGTFNGLAYGSANQVYFVPPEEVDAIEVGLKARLMESRLQVNVAAFTYDYTGQQGQVIDDTATGNLVSLDSDIRGLEVDMQFAATDSLTLSAALGLLDTEYASGECPDDPTEIPSFPAQLGSCIVSAAGPVSVAGNPIPFAAEESLNLSMDWDAFRASNGGLIAVHADASYTGDFTYDSFGNYDRPPLQNVATGSYTQGEGGYWVLNARVSYVKDDYTIAAWVRNLADEEYYPYGISLENLFGNGYRVRALPRTYGLELSYNF